MFLFAVVIYAALLIRLSWGIVFFFFTCVVVTVIALIYNAGTLDMSSPQRQIADEFFDWLGPSIAYIMVCVCSLGVGSDRIGTEILIRRSSLRNLLR